MFDNYLRIKPPTFHQYFTSPINEQIQISLINFRIIIWLSVSANYLSWYLPEEYGRQKLRPLIPATISLISIFWPENDQCSFLRHHRETGPGHFWRGLSFTNRRGSIVVRAHASFAEGLQFELDSMPRLNARSLFTQQQMGTWWQHWGDKSGEERNWPPYLKCRWHRISVLSNRHSPTYESKRDYLYLYFIVYKYTGVTEWKILWAIPVRLCLCFGCRRYGKNGSSS